MIKQRGRFRLVVSILALCLSAVTLVAIAASASESATAATILVYHRFGPVVADSMTVTTEVFASQLRYLHDHGYTVVPLRDVVNFAAGYGELPPRAVAITADDGHRTVFSDMKPLVERYRIPVTLFIYPSAISNASYAMTWEQLVELKATGLFSVESHTYWHPNFHIDKRRLSAENYEKFVDTQLNKSRQVLDHRLGGRVTMLSWPFGIYDDELIAAATKSGYVAAVTIERRKVTRGDNVMALPRFIVTNGDVGQRFESLLPTQTPITSR
ncbi:MAG: polysaccharide deacetylase family protein [Candidatus Binatus sp.]|uniref:polysaccharide deacetylase family protein n=1 Tax=Candidatus Binatus sp. TaxID=2811406 RepID=UPI00271C0860|nr:polysaccharide deacetylase family protein [Candidatus Binatus sp.]MDO8431025.1 polysaccharide deacetylase family protein [Candidatus Binatus sp.]